MSFASATVTTMLVEFEAGGVPLSCAVTVNTTHACWVGKTKVEESEKGMTDLKKKERNGKNREAQTPPSLLHSHTNSLTHKHTNSLTHKPAHTHTLTSVSRSSGLMA